MSRSVWKPIFRDADFERQLEKGETPLRASRTIKLTGDLLGKNVFVPNGRRFISINVQAEHLGHQTGEFSLTRAKVSNRNKKTLKK